MITNTKTSLQWSRSFQSCQPTTPRAMNGSTVIVPVAIRSAVSCLTGSTSSAVGTRGSADVVVKERLLGLNWTAAFRARSLDGCAPSLC